MLFKRPLFAGPNRRKTSNNTLHIPKTKELSRVIKRLEGMKFYKKIGKIGCVRKKMRLEKQQSFPGKRPSKCGKNAAKIDLYNKNLSRAAKEIGRNGGRKWLLTRREKMLLQMQMKKGGGDKNGEAGDRRMAADLNGG